MNSNAECHGPRFLLKRRARFRLSESMRHNTLRDLLESLADGDHADAPPARAGPAAGALAVVQPVGGDDDDGRDVHGDDGTDLLMMMVPMVIMVDVAGVVVVAAMAKYSRGYFC